VPGRSAAQRLAPGSARACADHVPSLRARRDQVLLERYADPLDAVDRDRVIERFLPLARGLAARATNAMGSSSMTSSRSPDRSRQGRRPLWHQARRGVLELWCLTGDGASAARR